MLYTCIPTTTLRYSRLTRIFVPARPSNRHPGMFTLGSWVNDQGVSSDPGGHLTVLLLLGMRDGEYGIHNLKFAREIPPEIIRQTTKRPLKRTT